MKTTLVVISLIIKIIKSQWKRITIPLILEFFLILISDFLEPKFSTIILLFILFSFTTIYCIYKIVVWFKNYKDFYFHDPETSPFNNNIGVKNSVLKGTPMSFFGLSLTCIYLVLLSFFGDNNSSLITSIIPELQTLQNRIIGVDKKIDSMNIKLDSLNHGTINTNNEISKKIDLVNSKIDSLKIEPKSNPLTVKKTRNKLDDAVKETNNTNPRKELNSIGVNWSGANFLEAVKDGDEQIVKLFLEGNINYKTAENYDRPLNTMLALNKSNPEKILKILLNNGVNIEYEYEWYTGMYKSKTTIFGRAIEMGNYKLVKALIENKTNINRRIQTFGDFKPLEICPLSLAIKCKQLKIALLILNANPDITIDDYDPYRRAYRHSYIWNEENPDQINEILNKTEPPSNIADKIRNRS